MASECFQKASDRAEKLKQYRSHLSDKLEAAEEREISAKQSKREADDRLEKSQEETNIIRGKISLGKAELEKIKRTVIEKEERLEHLEQVNADEEEQWKELEGGGQEVEDQVYALEEQSAIWKAQMFESSAILMDMERKLQVIQTEDEKVLKRYEAAMAREESLNELIEEHARELRDLEERDDDAADREGDAKEKLEFLGQQLKEETNRYEEAERDVSRNEEVVRSLHKEIDDCKSKRDDIYEELNGILTHCEAELAHCLEQDGGGPHHEAENSPEDGPEEDPEE